MKSIILVTLFCVMVVGLPTISYAANITRSCNAYYEITTTHRGMNITIQFGRFSTKGSCGKTVPNRCRERARNRAHQCMEEHWRIPAKADVFWQPCSDNYPISEQCLSCVIKERICETFRVNEIVVDVKAVTTGDKRCPKTNVLAENFRINCRR